MNPPSKAPAMPSSMVMTNPPGSRPGVTSFAIIPTTRPKTIHASIPITVLLAPPGIRANERTSSEQAGADDAFMLEQPLLTVEAAAIPRQPAVRTDDSVARNDNGDGIRAIGSPDGPDGGRVANPFRQLRI